MIFGKLFGKKEEEPKELTLTNLDVGYILDYDLRSWEVKTVYEYDWGNNTYTIEYKLHDGKENIYLHVDDGDDMECSVSRKANLFEISKTLKSHIISNDAPPQELHYKGETYYLDGDSPAHCRDVADGDGDDAWSELVNYVFINEKRTAFVNLDRWSENEIDAAVGTYVKPFEFSNFLPRA